MLRSYRIIAIALGLVFFVSLVHAQQSPNTSAKQQPVAQSGQANSAQNDSGKTAGDPEKASSFITAIEAISSAIREGVASQNKPDDPSKVEREKRDLAAQESMAFWTFWMFWATLGTVAVAAVGLYLVWQQLQQNSVAIAVAHRPWIKVDLEVFDTKHIKPPTGDMLSIAEMQGHVAGRGIFFSTEAIIENIGTTPAMQVQTNMKIVQSDYREDTDKIVSEFVESTIAKGFENGRMLAAGDSYERPWGFTADDGNFNIGESNEISPMIVGCVTYRSPYDADLHVTAFILDLSNILVPGGRFDVTRGPYDTETRPLSGGFAT